MGHSSVTCTFRIAAAIAAGCIGLAVACAEPPGNGNPRGPHDGQQGGKPWPVYQRHAFDWMQGPMHGDFRNKDRRLFQQPLFPNVQSGWFTRPYPYHLDYYKMRYGGSYAPYFGNLYGPPQVVTAPPYYGPYYGNWGYGWPEGYNGYNGYNGAPTEQPGYPPGTIMEGPVENATPSSQAAAPPNGEGLPAPGQ